MPIFGNLFKKDPFHFAPVMCQSVDFEANSPKFAISPDGAFFAFSGEKLGSPDPTPKLMIMQVGDGKTIELPVIPKGLYGYNFSADGAWFAYVSGSTGVTIWEAPAWNLLLQCELRGLRGNPDIHCIELSPARRKLAFSDWHGHLFLVDLNTSQVGQLDLHGPSVITAPLGNKVTCRLSPDGRSLYSGADDAMIYKSEIPDDFMKNQVTAKRFGKVGYAINEFLLSLDGSLLATSNFVSGNSDIEEIQIWDTQNGKVIKRIASSGHQVTRLTFTDQGQLLGLGGREIKSWSTATWSTTDTAKLNDTQRFTPQFSANGRYLVKELIKKSFEIWR